MLIDLDDTILSAYNNPGPLWHEVVSGFLPQLGGLTAEAARDAILLSGTAFWDDPERHRLYRQQMFPARREVVRLAFEQARTVGSELSLTRRHVLPASVDLSTPLPRYSCPIAA